MSSMAGLLGILGPPVEQNRLIAALTRSPWRGPISTNIATSHGGLYALGAAAAGHYGHIAVALHGRIDNRIELARNLNVDPADPVGIIARAYLQYGDDFADRLLGDFAALLIDEQRGVLLGVRDWIGARPLFWGRDGTTVAVASEVKQVLALLGLPFTSNEDALLAYTQQDEQPLDATFAANVHAVYPAGQILAEANQERTWRRDLRFDPIDIKLPEATELVRERLEVAVARRTAGATCLGVQISGGLDSTSVAATAASSAQYHQGPPVAAAFTASYPDVPICDETAWARPVADRWNIPWISVPIQPTEFLSWPSYGFTVHDGPTLSNLVVQAKLLAAGADHGVDVMLTGAGGDSWLRQYGHEFELALLRADWQGCLQWGRIYSRRLPRLAVKQTVGAVRGRLQRRRAETYFEQQAGRYGARIAWEGLEREGMRHGIRVESPFFDRELAAVLAGLPPSLRSTPVYSKHVLREAMRDLLPDIVLERKLWTVLDPVIAAAFAPTALTSSAGAMLSRNYEDAWRRNLDEAGMTIPS